MGARRTQGQGGAALIIVLIFISVFGLILSALMTESTVNVKYTTIVGDHEAKVYAADAGVSFGIQQLRQNNTLCPREGATGPPISTLTIDGPHGDPRTVEVECSVNSGSTGGLDGYAIITRSPDPDSLVLSNAHEKKIDGYVYVTGGVDWGPGLIVTAGDFIHQKQGSSCLNPPGPKLTLDSPPYDYYCKSVAEFPRPNPLYIAPAVPVVTNPGYTDVGTCRVFRPGMYTSPPTLRTGDNYFISGVYYFNLDDADPDNNVINVKQSTIYGGQPSLAEEAEQRFSLPADCADQDPPGSNTGVEFIFGAKAQMAIDTQGQAELFGRTGEPSPASSNVSFVAVPLADPGWPTGPGNWVPSSLASGTPVLDIKDGDQQDIAIHGVIYVPTAGVELTATNDVLAQAMSGLLVWTLEMKSSASAQGLSVSVAAGHPNPRHIKITATALGTGTGERPVQSSAVVEVSNDDSKTVTVESWRTRGPSDPL